MADLAFAARAPARAAQEWRLRVTAAIFGVAVVVHGIDHLRRDLAFGVAGLRVLWSQA